MFPNKIIFLLVISSAYVLLTSSQGVAQECKRIPQFEDYPVADVFKGKPVAPKLVTEETKRFQTRIREGAKEGPNFAGHYTVLTVGCGTSCGTLFIVDAKTGRVFYQPDVDIVGHNQPNIGYGEQNRLDSRLMIAFLPRLRESPEEVDKVIPDDIMFYEWKNDEFHLICKKRPLASAQTGSSGETETGEEAYTPPKGSEERRAIMDALREVVKKMSNLNVIFVVKYLKVKNGWAWVDTDPQSPDGMDHYEPITGLLHKVNGRWTFLEGPPEWSVCEKNPDCTDSTRYFKKLAAKYPSLPPDIFPK